MTRQDEVREAFERHCTVPDGIRWRENSGQYVADPIGGETPNMFKARKGAAHFLTLRHNDWRAACEWQSQKAQGPEYQTVAAEAYQVIGALAEGPAFESAEVQRALDYFSLLMVSRHKEAGSILPFHPPAPAAVPEGWMIKARGEIDDFIQSVVDDHSIKVCDEYVSEDEQSSFDCVTHKDLLRQLDSFTFSPALIAASAPAEPDREGK